MIAALDAARVVTLTGVGGVGKTRLALQVAAEVLPRVPVRRMVVRVGAGARAPRVCSKRSTNLFDVKARSGQTLEQALVEFLRDKELLAGARQLRARARRGCRAGGAPGTVVFSGHGVGDQPRGSRDRRGAHPRGAVAERAARRRVDLDGRGRRGRGAALRGPGAGARRRVRDQRRQRGVGRPGLSAPGWSPVGDRARGGAGAGDEPARVGGASRSPLPGPRGRAARQDRTSSDAAGGDRLVLRPVERGRTAAARPGDGVQRRMDARRRRGRLCRRCRRRDGRLRADRSGWWPGRWWSPRITGSRPATGCWRRSASTGRNASPNTATPTSCAAGTPSTSSSSPASCTPGCTVPTRSSAAGASMPSTRTSSPSSVSRSMRSTPTPRCAWYATFRIQPFRSATRFVCRWRRCWNCRARRTIPSTRTRRARRVVRGLPRRP